MKTTLTLLIALLSAAVYAAPATQPAPQPQAKIAQAGDDVDTSTPFQICIFPGLPKSQATSYVHGFKLGAPVSYGHGHVYGLEASVLYSGTDSIYGGQASIVFCKSKSYIGAEAALGVVMNTDGFYGGLAAPIFAYAGPYDGFMASSVCISGAASGLQAAAICNVTRGDFEGFQAATIANIVKGNFSGIQCGVYNQVKEHDGIQFGIINRAEKTGLQFGLINIIKDGSFLPVFPIFNVSL